ncbi:acyl-CoA dehydrogenase family protein [Marinobacter zhanjiangensis]|uniref:Acyl-CoA dehydrogenase n=1 Tax=Marinobacter zhanjiangensis TaxID=578215 RepID=A0ABQ3B2U6_9GAMM|nr:acyl-CoA dehydrogenase family protein [Marinobacter zhanjiangensis]GGY75159.1 acyl-CoA dehydrogenase [Marinobacter zhanjiangensis]
MDFQYSDKVKELRQQLLTFMDEYIYPNEEVYQQQKEANQARGRTYAKVPIVDELKEKAKAQGLWNLFLPEEEYGPGLTNLEYAPLAEIMGRVLWSSEVFNCAAPDTGNMEVLARYGSEEQQATWLRPLLDGQIRSSFAMTEPAVASSDATNIETLIQRDGDDYLINGRKWFITGGCAEETKFFIVMGKSDPDNADRHKQQSMIIVPKDTPGVTIVRDMPVYGYYHAPKGHPEILFDNVRVPAGNLILGEGRGFEIAQGRLGPGRIHHCMRVIGQAERAFEIMCQRLTSRVAFHKPLADQGVWRERIADCRIAIDQTRLMVLQAAQMMDLVGNKVAKQQIAMIKVAAPDMALKVIDWAIQAHGAGGYTEDFPLADMWVYARHLRTADGPDEVHRNSIAKEVLKAYR